MSLGKAVSFCLFVKHLEFSSLTLSDMTELCSVCRTTYKASVGEQVSWINRKKGQNRYLKKHDQRTKELNGGLVPGFRCLSKAAQDSVVRAQTNPFILLAVVDRSLLWFYNHEPGFRKVLKN